MLSDTIQITFAFLSLVFAVVQTVRIKKLRKYQNTHLLKAWQSSKKLSHNLLILTEKEVSREACGTRAQRLEEDIVNIIVNVNKINRKWVEEKYREKDIDEFDYKLLKKLTLDLR